MGRTNVSLQRMLRVAFVAWVSGGLCIAAESELGANNIENKNEAPTLAAKLSSSFPPMNTYVPMVSRTAYALAYLPAVKGAAPLELPTLQLAVDSSQEDSGVVTVYQSGPGEVVVVFQAGNGSQGAPPASADSTQTVPFLEPFLYTAAAPSAIVSLFEDLLNREQTGSADMSLTQAVSELASGENLKRMTCLGEGPYGGLAILCGAWAGLNNPMANVAVFTLNTPWEGYNPQFAWAFTQLVTYKLLWPFRVPEVVPDSSPGTPLESLYAAALNSLVTAVTTQQAVTLPNMPEEGIIDMISESIWGPVPDLSPSQQLPESACPIMICKSREPLRLSCLGFDNQTAPGAFGSRPYKLVYSPTTAAVAAVSWDAAGGTLYLLWKYSASAESWVEDAKFETVSDLPYDGALQPGVVFSFDALKQLFPGLEIHLGFLEQFTSLIQDQGAPESDLMAAIEDVTGGAQPSHVVLSGFSLGGAVSELSAVWASQQWPAADVMVADQGAPMAGNSEFVLMFQAAVGRGYKYINDLDQVPTLPPIPPYEHTPGSLWLHDGLVLAEVIPITDEPETFWSDHNCWNTDPVTAQEAPGYVPKVDAATKVTVPAWVF